MHECKSFFTVITEYVSKDTKLKMNKNELWT